MGIMKLVRKPVPASTSAASVEDSPVESVPSSTEISPAQSVHGSPEVVDLKRHHAFRILAGELYRQCLRDLEMRTDFWSAVALRVSRAHYATYPGEDAQAAIWLAGVHQLNPEACISFTTDLISGIMETLVPGSHEVVLSPVDRVQVIETMAELGTVRKAQGACFVRTEQRIVAWTDNAEWLIDHIRRIERKMTAYVWQQARGSFSNSYSLPSMTPLTPRSGTGLMTGANTPSAGAITPMMQTAYFGSITPLGANTPSPTGSGLGTPSMMHGDLSEKEEYIAPPPEDFKPEVDEAGNPIIQSGRHVMVLGPLYTGLALALNIVICGLIIRPVVIEVLLDGNYIRCAILAILPFLLLINQFWCQNIIGVIAMILGPIAQMQSNSLYYSGKASPRLPINAKLPHVTIQMPVYKESLEGVLAPTIESVNKAIATYELQGGTANLLISEDGMQLLNDEERTKRLEYYDVHNCNWVARPGHNQDGYIRKGRFKKASNLNETCKLSLRVEQLMEELKPRFEEQDALYEAAFDQALSETNGKMWASGNIRIGDVILMIDSDTRVPEDCFLDAASEMAACPEAAVIQHSSGVMYVANHYFERMIGYFTEVVNYSISWTVANGGVAPFVGHNAFLRWRALQEASFVDEDGEQSIWSSAHVSEDFDMAMRLLQKGYVVRWATYSNNEFLEGVSLTPDDEINRWQKYAWGCSELVLNPLRQWLFRGPLSKQFRTFLGSKQCTTVYKFDACSYIFSYWALATAVPLNIALYFVQGFFGDKLDPLFISPFQVLLSILVVFVLGGNVGLMVSQARCGHRSFFSAAKRSLTWLPCLFVFFGGLSYHVLLAILCHPLGISMSWGATVKDVEESNFFVEVPAILKRFWHTFVVMFGLLAAVIVLALPVIPLGWRIMSWPIILPPVLLASMHILYAFVLNPWVAKFSF